MRSWDENELVKETNGCAVLTIDWKDCLTLMLYSSFATPATQPAVKSASIDLLRFSVSSKVTSMQSVYRMVVL